jgi:hypothetical protein
MQTKIIYSKNEKLINTINSLILFRIDDYMFYKKDRLYVDNTVYDIDNKVLNVYVTKD